MSHNVDHSRLGLIPQTEPVGITAGLDRQNKWYVVVGVVVVVVVVVVISSSSNQGCSTGYLYWYLICT